MSERLGSAMSELALSVAAERRGGRSESWRRRLVGALIGLAGTAVLGLAAFLTPATSGVGTHEQLNLPPCQWIALMDLPCPTCGMTTSFAHAADGHFLRSAHTQPMGFVLAMATAMGVLVGGYVLATGSPILVLLGRLLTPRAGWLAGGLLLGAWTYKILSHKGLFG